jgi:hypothetical protein
MPDSQETRSAAVPQPLAQQPAIIDERGNTHAEEPDNAVSADFMLHEYEALRARFEALRSEGINRLNFFLTLTSAVVGGFIILGGNSGLPAPVLRAILLIALLLLAIVGLDVYQYTITRDRVSDTVVRGMNRIRRYFVERDPDLEKFLMYPPDDELTSYIADRSSLGVRRIAQTVHSFIIGLAVGLVIDLLTPIISFSFLIGIITFVIDFSILEFYGRRKLRRAYDLALEERVFPKKG